MTIFRRMCDDYLERMSFRNEDIIGEALNLYLILRE